MPENLLFPAPVPVEMPRVSTNDTDPRLSLTEIMEQGEAHRKYEEDQRRILEDHDASLFTAISGAWRFDTGTGVAASYLKDAVSFDTDEDFNVEEELEVDAWEFPETSDWEQNVLKSAKSREHYDVLKARIKDRREYLLNARDLGLAPSMALQLVAEFGNVPNYFSFGLGGLAKVNKMKRFLTAGSVVGSANVAEEAFINTMYNDRTVTDYVAAGALGMGLGWLGTLGGDAGRAAHIEDTGNKFAETHVASKLEEFEDAQAAPSTVGAEQIPNTFKILYPDFDETKLRPRVDEDSPVIQDTVRALMDGDIPKAKELLHERFGLASMSQSLHSSDNPVARFLASELLEFPEGVGRMNKHTAALESDLDFTHFTATYAPEYLRIKAAWQTAAEKRGITETFDEAATSWIGNGGSNSKSTVEMDQLLDDFNKLYNDMNEATFQIMKDSGVYEAAIEKPDFDHLFRMWDGDRFTTARQEYGDDTVLEALQESILEGNDFKSTHAKADAAYKEEVRIAEEGYNVVLKRAEEKLEAAKKAAKDGDVSPEGLRKQRDVEVAQRKLDEVKKNKPEVKREPPKIEETARRMAQALYNRFLNRATMTTADANLLSSGNRQLLMDALSDLDLDEIDMTHIKRILDTAGKDHAAQPFKHQMGMNLGHRHKSGLRIVDLMHNDLGSAYTAKQRYWLGRSAAARHGFDSEQAFSQAVDQMKRHGQDRGMENKDIRMDAAKLDAGWKMIMGQPIEDMSAPGIAAMRVVRKAMATSALGKLGIVQAGETGRAMAAVGIKNVFESLPVMADLLHDMRNGIFDTPTLLDFEEHIFGRIGDDHYMNHPDFRADDFGYNVNKYEKQLDRMGFWLSKASGWHIVHKTQKRFLMNGLAQKWHREFTDGTMTVTQMNDLGVPLHHYEGIKRMLKTHAEDIEGTKAKNLNIGKWEPELRRTFALMLHRKTNNAIQAIIVGETPLWLNHGVGKFIGQFRTFSIAALGKQTVHDWRMHKEGDKEAALAFQFMLATSAMATVSRTGFEALALPTSERGEYLERNMNVRAITRRVLNYHGQASPLVDAAEFLGKSFMPDTWGNITGNSLYYNGRGLTSQVPGLSYANRAFKGAKGVSQALLPGEEMSKSDWKAFVGVLPLSSWYGFHVLNKSIATPVLFPDD